MKLVSIVNILDGKDFPEAGSALYPFIESAINTGQMLVIDMTGVDSIPTLFMNTSFGKAMDRFGVEALRCHVSFCHIKKSQAERIKDYIRKYEAAYLADKILE